MSKIILVDAKGEEMEITENQLVILRQKFMNESNLTWNGRKLDPGFYELIHKDENGNPYLRIET